VSVSDKHETDSNSNTRATIMKTLVFVHGYLGGSQQWIAQAEAFSKHFQVITPDLPGFGLNNEAQAPESINGFARYIIDELDRSGVENFHLVGHSMGGMIVQEIIALVPERVDKLILYGTGPVGLLPGRFETLDESRRRVEADGVEATGRRISATWFQHGEVARGYQSCADITSMAHLQAALAGLTAMEGWSGVASLTKIKSHTLVLWGDGDRAYQWAQPEMLWRKISNVNLAVVPGCSHAVHLEKPKLFNAILQDFLVSSN
jgi:2-hydroxy-6-oxonona-2,4-dienedioate hydrolase